MKARRSKKFFAQFAKTWRVRFILTFFVFLYLILTAHIYSVQIDKGTLYAAKAESQYRSSGFLAASRGTIFFQDKNGRKIQAAVTKDMPVLYAVPSEIEDPEEAALVLSELSVELDYDRLVYIFAKPDDPYEPILSRVSGELAEAITRLDINGIYVGSEPRRYYPNGPIASHLMGFIAPTSRDSTVRGRYGLESYYESELVGIPGYLDEQNLVVPPEDGADIVLTIDYNIQRQAEVILRNLMEKHNAKRGTIIVEDPQTGKILAMVNAPNFNGNEYSEFPISSYTNDAVEAVYEPGSVFKVITMAIGLDTGKITPDTAYYDTGKVTLNGRTIKNWDFEKRGKHGRLTMTEVIENSVNTGSVFAESQIGHDLFYNYLLKFGIDENTGIDLPGEVSGNLGNLRGHRDINFATASFGQGVAVTPIALTNALSVLANGGLLVRPYVVEAQESQSGGFITTQPKVIRRVISERTSREITEMMVSAVKKNILADISQYEIAGKTGTAQAPNLYSGGYYDDKLINTFIGFAPASNPQFVVMIKLDEPEGALLAGQTVLPAFRELTEFILNYYQIPPDSI